MVYERFEPSKEIYIQVKQLIVDDVFYTIGSANYNWRSLDGNPECNVGVHNGRQTRELRREIMNMLISDLMDDLMPEEGPMEACNRWVSMVGGNNAVLPTPNHRPNNHAITYGPDTNSKWDIPNSFVQREIESETGFG